MLGEDDNPHDSLYMTCACWLDSLALVYTGG